MKDCAWRPDQTAAQQRPLASKLAFLPPPLARTPTWRTQLIGVQVRRRTVASAARVCDFRSLALRGSGSRSRYQRRLQVKFRGGLSKKVVAAPVFGVLETRCHRRAGRRTRLGGRSTAVSGSRRANSRCWRRSCRQCSCAQALAGPELPCRPSHRDVPANAVRNAGANAARIKTYERNLCPYSGGRPSTYWIRRCNLLRSIKDNYKKAEAAAVAENLLQIFADSGISDLPAARTANRIISDVWERAPTLLSGRQGPRPHKATFAAAAFSSAINAKPAPDHPEKTTYMLCLGKILEHFSLNASGLNKTDQMIIDLSLKTFKHHAQEMSKSPIGEDIEMLLSVADLDRTC